MTGWQVDKKWTDFYLPEVKRILGEALIGEPPVEEDQQRNTDLIVLRMEAVRIGVRIRKEKYMKSYAQEFTIRTFRPSGTKTELRKIIEGWGDYFFYGFAGNDSLKAFVLADLNIFRSTYHDMVSDGAKKWVEKTNYDGSSDFCAFQWRDFPRNFIVYSGRV